MTRKELQDALRPYKAEYAYIKLNAKTEQLQAWWDEINALDSNDEVEPNQELNGQTCELTSAVRLPQVLDLQWFANNYSCPLPVDSITEVESAKEQSPTTASFGTVIITTISIVTDAVVCFADMVKQVYKQSSNQISKRRRKVRGFAV